MPTATAVRSVSLATKIRQITGLAGTINVDKKTNAFLESIEDLTADGRDTSMLKDGQIRWIDQIWRDNFA